MAEVEKCLICEAPTSEMHRDINCCRACAIFYKRTLARLQMRPLKCKRGGEKCTSKKPKGMCRKCRFERFAAILAESSEMKSTDERKQSVEVSGNIIAIPPQDSFNVISSHKTNKYNSDSICCDISILGRMKEAYRVLCIMRMNAEMNAYPSQIRDQLEQGNMKYAPATYTNVVPHAGIMFAGLLNFFSSTFEDFKKMSNEQQQQLLFRSFELINRGDDIYRAVHYFPDDDTFMPSFTTVFSIDKIDDFLSDCHPGINKEEAKKEIVKNTKRALVVNKTHFKRVQLTLEEFLLFLGLALWKDDTSIEDENIAEMAKRNREDIISELHRFYAAKERSDYSARMGEIFCLLLSMEGLAQQHREDREVYKLMHMFTEYADLK